MTDRHLNLFYTYGGSARWEDNFTRAFLVALRNLAPAHFRMFLRDLLLDGADEELRDRVDLRAEEDPVFDLQVSDAARDGDPLLTSENGVLVTIDTTGAEELTIKDGSSDGGARIDALIDDPDAEVTAVIEVKLGDWQSRDQLRRHHQAFFKDGESEPDDVHVAVSWEDVVEYLESLRRQSVSGREEYVLQEFVEYADELGLAPFQGFQEKDFRRSRNRPLRKLLQVVVARYGEKLQAEVGSDAAHRLDFDGISENVWIDYGLSPDRPLRVSVVAGADGIWHSRQLKKAFQANESGFCEIGDELVEAISRDYSHCEVAWRPKTRFYASRGQQEYPPAARSFSHTDEFDAFVARLLDDERNPCEWVTRDETEHGLGDELAEVPTEEDDVLALWGDKDEVLVSTFFHLDVVVPQEELVGNGRSYTVETIGDLLGPLRTSARQLSQLKNAA